MNKSFIRNFIQCGYLKKKEKILKILNTTLGILIYVFSLRHDLLQCESLLRSDLICIGARW